MKFNPKLKEIALREGLTVAQFFLLLAISSDSDIVEDLGVLKKKGAISAKYDNGAASGYFLPDKGIKLVNSIILDSDEDVGKIEVAERLETLVVVLQEIFPKGKKEGTSHYWRGNKPDIKRKLQSFLLKYGDLYTDEQILSAAQTYVDGFNGQYRFMRLLQYFIWKEEIKDGTKTLVSPLADYLENEGAEVEYKDDWTSTIC